MRLKSLKLNHSHVGRSSLTIYAVHQKRLIIAKCVFSSAFCDPRGPSPGRTWQSWDPAHLPSHTAEPYDPELEVRHQEDGRWWQTEAWVPTETVLRFKTRRGSPSAPQRCQFGWTGRVFADSGSLRQQPSLGDTPPLAQESRASCWGRSQMSR